jgi:hypothetical protein
MPAPYLCTITHPLLLSGKCRWCQCFIVEGQVSEEAKQARGVTHWNVTGLLKALDAEDETVREVTLANLLFERPTEAGIFEVLEKGMADPCKDIASVATDALVQIGAGLLESEATALEREVERSPENLALRIALLGFYWPRSFLFDSERFARSSHILWIIEKCPALSILRDRPEADLDSVRDNAAWREAKRLWDKRTTETKDPHVLGNAARFFRRADPRRSAALLEKAQQLEPGNRQWPMDLATVYSSPSGCLADPEASQKALAVLEEMSTPTNDAEKGYHLQKLAKAAIGAHELAKARLYGTQLVERARGGEFGPESGNALHHGNLILGRLAFKAGDVEEAKRFLLESAKVPGTPQLESFGPDLALAKELLAEGQQETVIQFLILCGNFWQSPQHELDQWIYAIRQGKNPWATEHHD